MGLIIAFSCIAYVIIGWSVATVFIAKYPCRDRKTKLKSGSRFWYLISPFWPIFIWVFAWMLLEKVFLPLYRGFWNLCLKSVRKLNPEIERWTW